jgi:hypothetical protein
MSMKSYDSKSKGKNISPYQIFWSYHSQIGNTIPSTKEQGNLNRFIHCKTSVQCLDELKVYTYSIKPPKRGPDDEVYAKNPILVSLLPRAMSLIFNLQGDFLCILSGPCKFSGAQTLDEDEAEDGFDCSVYDPAKTEEWITSETCEITKTIKANGKFAICTMFVHEGRSAIAFGSKNCHFVCYVDDMDTFLHINPEVSDIVRSIGLDIFKNITKLERLAEYFYNGFSLVGELEDGMHFVPGDNTVSWFGLFKNGIPMEATSALSLISSFDIKTVKHEVVFNPGDPLDKLQHVLNMSKCDEGEGSVLYIRNVATGDTQLAKSKSAIYKLKRMFRQKWLWSPTTIDRSLISRVIETKDYHGLNTSAAIRITRRLFDFALWLSENHYPTQILNYMPVSSARGILQPGFSFYWSKFITETEHEDIHLTPEDFGEFDESSFSSTPELRLFPVPDPLVRPLVIFLQDIQGGGKSTIAHSLKGVRVVEQDICYGCTRATQFQLLKHISRGENVIVSRCNASEKQYSAYLKIAMNMNCRILFVSTNNVKSELRLCVALAGILNRSREGDSVMVGRLEYPFAEVISFTQRNWKEFQKHSKAIMINTFATNVGLADRAKTACHSNQIQKFVMDNRDALMSLRKPLKDIVSEIQALVDHPPTEFLIEKTLADTIYVGLNVVNKNPLLDFVKTNCETEGKTFYCEHLTQVFLGKKSTSQVNVVKADTSCSVTIDSLVINKENGSAAYHITNVVTSSGENVEIESRKPHITALVAPGSKPVDSIKFVCKKDDSVIIVPFECVIETICVWN